MARTDQGTALIGVFAERGEAEHFVDELKQAGFRTDQVGILTPDQGKASSVVEDDATVGAITGGTFGALAGVALTSGLLPGIGPILAGGSLLVGLLGGAAAGATAGGVLGALVGLGVSEDEAKRYESELKAGRTLVVVQGESRLADAYAILRRIQDEESVLAKPEVEQLDELT